MGHSNLTFNHEPWAKWFSAQEEMYSRAFVVVIFVRLDIFKWPECPLVERWVRKVCCADVLGGSAAVKRCLSGPP